MFANGAGSDKDFVTGHCYHDNAGFLLGNFLSFPLNDSYRLSSTNTLNSTYQYLENRLSYAENVDELIDLIEEQYPEILHEDMETRTIAMAECTTDWSFGYKSYVMADDHVQYVFSSELRTVPINASPAQHHLNVKFLLFKTIMN